MYIPYAGTLVMLLPINGKLTWKVEVITFFIYFFDAFLHFLIRDEDQGMRETLECLLYFSFQAHLGR